MQVRKKFVAGVAVVGLAFTGMMAPAQAGGLFGKGGLIRGSVGEVLDRNVEQPITTPLARTATVAGGAIAGAVVGAKVGLPKTGALIGAGVGQAINDLAAGKY